MRRLGPDRLHPLRVQLRHRGPARRAHARADPRRQGAPRLAGLHVQQGDAARPLPERPAPSDLADAAPRRTAATRRSTGTPRSPRSPPASRIADEHGGESIFYYGGGGQGNHLGGAYSGAFLRALGSRYRSSALGAGEDRRGLGRALALRRPHARRVRARRGRGVRRQEPVDVAELPARARGAARDRQGPGAVDDRDRPGPDRHRQARRLPPARAAGHRRLVPGRAGRRARPGGPRRPRVPRRARERRRGRARALRPGRRRRLRASAAASTRP